MPIASIHRSIVAIGTFLVAASSPAQAQEASEPAAAETSVTTSIATFTFHTGYQFSNHEALQGLAQSIVLGFRGSRADAPRVHFFEAGSSRLATDDSPLVTSSAMLGARIAWRWDRLALHLFGRFHHGEPIPGDDSVAIYSHSTSLGLMATFDILRRKGGSMALGLHGFGQFYDASDGDDYALAGSGAAGLSILAW